jgi:transcriptional regulator with PAS, ATPase and Fis domain
MKRRDEPLGSEPGLGAVKRLTAQLAAAFSKTSAVALAIFDNQLRFRAINNAMAAINGVPAESLIEKTIREIIGDAAPEPEVRLRRVLAAGETPPVEVSMKLPTRTEPGYWIVKNFIIKGRSGRLTQIASLAVEVSDNRNLEQNFRKLGSELPWKNQEYHRLARELHDAIDGYHAAVKVNLNRLSQYPSDPERIPELLEQSMEFLDERMRKLAAAVARCFPTDQQ